jgi:hypothetical protein
VVLMVLVPPPTRVQKSYRGVSTSTSERKQREQNHNYCTCGASCGRCIPATVNATYCADFNLAKYGHTIDYAGPTDGITTSSSYCRVICVEPVTKFIATLLLALAIMAIELMEWKG